MSIAIFIHKTSTGSKPKGQTELTESFNHEISGPPTWSMTSVQLQVQLLLLLLSAAQPSLRPGPLSPQEVDPNPLVQPLLD